MDTLFSYGFRLGFGTFDAVGCNWVAFNSMSRYTIRQILPQDLTAKYPLVNFDLQIVHQEGWGPEKGYKPYAKV